jgi:hypothetical protein
MSQQFQQNSWRGADGEQVWLSALVDAMEQIAQPRRVAPDDSRVLVALRAQLALPTPTRLASPFSLRN